MKLLSHIRLQLEEGHAKKRKHSEHRYRGKKEENSSVSSAYLDHRYPEGEEWWSDRCRLKAYCNRAIMNLQRGVLVRELWKLTSSSCSVHQAMCSGSVLCQPKKGQPFITYKRVLSARLDWMMVFIP